MSTNINSRCHYTCVYATRMSSAAASRSYITCTDRAIYGRPRRLYNLLGMTCFWGGSFFGNHTKKNMYHKHGITVEFYNKSEMNCSLRKWLHFPHFRNLTNFFMDISTMSNIFSTKCSLLLFYAVDCIALCWKPSHCFVLYMWVICSRL